MARSKPPLKSAHKDEWVAYAISRGVPSYEAWELTVEELVEKFAEPEPAPPAKPAKAARPAKRTAAKEG